MTDDDVEQYWTQYWPLKCPTSHWLEHCPDDGFEFSGVRELGLKSPLAGSSWELKEVCMSKMQRHREIWQCL